MTGHFARQVQTGHSSRWALTREESQHLLVEFRPENLCGALWHWSNATPSPVRPNFVCGTVDQSAIPEECLSRWLGFAPAREERRGEAGPTTAGLGCLHALGA